MFIISFLNSSQIYLWDEGAYLSTAENLFSNDPYYTEIDFRPPLYPLMIKMMSGFFGLETAAHLISSFLFALAILTIFFLGKEIYDEKAGLFAAALLGLSPFIFYSSTKIMTDVPSISLALLGIYFSFRYVCTNNRKILFLSGVFIGLSILTRFIFILFVPLILLIMVMNKSKLKDFFNFFVFLGVPLIPYFIWAQLSTGFFLWPFIKGQIMVAGSELIFEKSYYLGAIYSVSGPIVILGTLLYLFSKKNKTDVILISWILLFFIYLTILPHKELRYILPAMPAFYLLFGKGFSNPKNKVFRVFIFSLGIILLIYPFLNAPRFNGSQDAGEPILLERTENLIPVAQYISLNLPENYTVYSHSFYPLIAYYSKKKTSSTWPWTEEFYEVFPENMKSDGWYLHYKNIFPFTNIDKQPTEEWLDSNAHFEKIKEFDKIVIYAYKKTLYFPENLT